MVKSKKKVKVLIGILSILVIFLFVTSFAYYTNIGRWLDQQKNAYVDGEGQTRLSDDFIEDGCGTGTMLDTVTGLCWAKNLNIASGKRTWSNAVSDCDSLTLAGHTDWRLPDMSEYYTLLDEIGGSGQTCTTLTSIGFTNCQNDRYWTKTTYGLDTGIAYGVYLNDAFSSLGDKTDDYYVACVRRN